MPDLSYLDRFNTKSFASRGIIRSLDDYMRTAKHARIANYFPREQNDTTYQGKPWAVPHGPVVGLLYLNRSLFKDAGLDPDEPPTTWDATVTAVQRLTKRAGGATTQVGWAPQRASACRGWCRTGSWAASSPARTRSTPPSTTTRPFRSSSGS